MLHPRGSEYQTQYVVDGIPLTDNRSPSFAPEIEANDAESMTILTANFPQNMAGSLAAWLRFPPSATSARAFTASLCLGRQLRHRGRLHDVAAGMGQKYSWHQRRRCSYRPLPRSARARQLHQSTTTGSFAAHYERDLTERDRLGFIVRHQQTVFQIPNEFVQQAAGQRQDRDSNETIGILSYQHVFSSNLLADFPAHVER